MHPCIVFYLQFSTAFLFKYYFAIPVLLTAQQRPNLIIKALYEKCVSRTLAKQHIGT